jgi:DnaJ homolog subfamily C member 28
MKRWESLIDQKIREGMEQGEFDHLAGKGAPVDLSENPFEDPDWRSAHRMLRNAGFAPAWIEERKDIDADFAAALNQLRRAWLVLKNAQGSENERRATSRWEQAVQEFRSQTAQLNRRVVAWNLKVPATGFARKRIDADREIQHIRES